MLAKFLGKIKGDNTVVDSRIPASYLLRLAISKAVSLLWGMIRLRRIGKYYIHPSSKIKCSTMIKCGKNFSIGQDCYVDALSENGLICGENVSMGFHTHLELTGSVKFLGKGMKIGNHVGLGSHGHYGSGMGFVEIGDYTIFGNYVSLHPENHNYSDPNLPIREQGVHSVGGIKIGANCWIGAKVTFLDGAEIGDNCIVAAGALVNKRFPDNVIIAGVPARVIKETYPLDGTRIQK